jgi:ABC-type Co2+ transport system permease subunit
MHMADALISPAVGGTMWAAAAGLVAYSSRKVKDELDDRKIPLMGVLGAFIFAAQMINFTIPGTGSSGHLGGALILAVLLGPYAAFLTIASVLTIQALWLSVATSSIWVFSPVSLPIPLSTKRSREKNPRRDASCWEPPWLPSSGFSWAPSAWFSRPLFQAFPSCPSRLFFS